MRRNTSIILQNAGTESKTSLKERALIRAMKVKMAVVLRFLPRTKAAGKASSNNVANGTGEKGKAKRHNVAKGAGKKGQGMVLSSKQPLKQPQTVTFKQPLELRPAKLQADHQYLMGCDREKRGLGFVRGPPCTVQEA